MQSGKIHQGAFYHYCLTWLFSQELFPVIAVSTETTVLSSMSSVVSEKSETPQSMFFFFFFLRISYEGFVLKYSVLNLHLSAK